jgi:hypothetical protein
MEMKLLNSTLYEWYSQFKNSQESLENEECISRPAMLRKNKNLVEVHAVMTTDGGVMI